MELSLVDANDMVAETQMLEDITSVKECSTDNDVPFILEDVHTLAVGVMESVGYRGYILSHPEKGYDVNYFVNEGRVMMVDNNRSNSLTVQVLDKEQTEWFLNAIKETFGEDELEN